MVLWFSLSIYQAACLSLSTSLTYASNRFGPKESPSDAPPPPPPTPPPPFTHNNYSKLFWQKNLVCKGANRYSKWLEFDFKILWVKEGTHYTLRQFRSGKKNTQNFMWKIWDVLFLLNYPPPPCPILSYFAWPPHPPLKSDIIYVRSLSGARNGTCYTATECSAKSGIASGNCAAG